MAKQAAVAKRAAALLEKARAERAVPCIVGQSKHASLIEEMKRQGAGIPLIASIVRDELGEDAAPRRESIYRHLKRECRCYRGDKYRDRGAVRK